MRDIDDYAKEYAVLDFEDYQVRYRRKLVLEQIERYKPKTVLEIGCGYEPLFKYISGIQCTVVEPALNFYTVAKEMAKTVKNTPRIIRGGIEDVIDELDNNYDMIICSSLLHEVEDPVTLLNSVKKICNDKTIVHINVPNANSIHRLLALESGMIPNTHYRSERNNRFQQNNVFDLKSLQYLIKKMKLTVIEKGSYFIKPFTHEQMYEMIKSGIISEKILDGLYNIGKYMPDLGSEIYVNCKKSKL